jgi:hypothetical protein
MEVSSQSSLPTSDFRKNAGHMVATYWVNVCQTLRKEVIMEEVVC